jgi:hypothetical protein
MDTNRNVTEITQPIHAKRIPNSVQMTTFENHTTILLADGKKNPKKQDRSDASVDTNPSPKKKPRTFDMIIGNDGVEQDQMETTALIQESCNKVKEEIQILPKCNKVVITKPLQKQQHTNSDAINNISPTHITENVAADLTIIIPQENELLHQTQVGASAKFSDVVTKGLQGTANIPKKMVSSYVLLFMSGYMPLTACFDSLKQSCSDDDF